MRHRFVLVVWLALLVVGGVFVGIMGRPAEAQVPFAVGSESLPPGVSVQKVLERMDSPVAMAFDPAGRLFYTEKNSGNVRLFANGALQTAPVIHFTVSTTNEQGLLGIAIDPNFSANHFVYVYYTCPVGAECAALENKVVRFEESNGVGSNPTTIFSSHQTSDHHNGGNIHFGPDGKLYISIGDNATPANSQDVTVTNGKMLRINSDGSMPTDNPVFTQTGALPSLYAIGLRNSFDFTFDPVVSGRMFASENGPGCDDEMNRIEAGYNYGWRADYPCYTGGNVAPEFNTIQPLWASGGLCCPAPTGITVYTGDMIPEWHNHLFMAVYQDPRRMYHFYLNDTRTAITAVNSVPAVLANMDLETGPDGALWYINGGGFDTGTLYRVGRFGDVATATVTATPVGSANPTSVAGSPTVVATPGSGGATIPGIGSRTFPETGKSVEGIFLDYWDKNGGLAQQGYPISELMNEVSDLDGKSYVVQYFERAVFEYHPENADPYKVLLSQLGTFGYKEKYPNGASGQTPNVSAGSRLFAETGFRVGGKFLEYWDKNGGLAQQGYPISDEFQEKSDLDGKTYTVQYFERAVFELHPENAGTLYEVLLSQLGRFRYGDGSR